jgi:hypothetical protein
MSIETSAVAAGSHARPSADEALALLDLAGLVFETRCADDLAGSLLPAIARLMQSPAAFLYVADPRLPAPCLLAHGVVSQAIPEIERLCAEQFEQLAGRGTSQLARMPAVLAAGTAGLALWPLQTDNGCSGLLGVATAASAMPVSPQALERLLHLVANTVSCVAERAATDRQLAHLNAYMTVSSMLVQSLNLHETLEGVLYCCMDAVSAEAASVLLLDDEMARFRFYHVEGPAQPSLKDATLPLDEGIAGYVLRTQKPVIVSDAQSDPRFCVKFDSESGFQTRNMIAVPLTSGEEQIGVLEVLNKTDAGTFSEEEQLLLLSIAEEIALAIRNAKVFEFVANSYCRVRQGESSCRGCHRPLGTWTPCVQYRKTAVSGLWRLSDAPWMRTSGG